MSLNNLNCIIRHNNRKTSKKTLDSLIQYLEFADSIFYKSSLITNKIIVYDDYNKKISRDFLSGGKKLLLLDSDEIPSINFISSLNLFVDYQANISVPLIHLKYEYTNLQLSGKNMKFKKFIDNDNMFFGANDQIDIRLPGNFSDRAPKIPLSSKWTDWPNNKFILFTDFTRENSVEVANMSMCSYKIENVGDL